MDALAPLTEEDGVLVRCAAVDGFTVAELAFPSGYAQRPFEPEEPYLAVVISGSLVKSFGPGLSLETGAALTMPRGAAHGARFGPQGARVVIVKGPMLHFERLTELRGLGLLARRLAAELRATDSAAALAAEGIALQLLASTERASRPVDREPPWLDAAEELLRSRRSECVRLSELACEVGETPVQVARAFRARHGMSVGEYGRRLRLEWAAGQLASGDRPLAEIAAEAGFADQSHFTRLFKAHVGTTPSRFRAFQHR